MSDFTVIGDVGNTLKGLLDDEDQWEGIEKPEITFRSPKEIKDGDQDPSVRLVSLFLYYIQVNPNLRNEEPIRKDDTKLLLPPLSLDLYYLITPYSFSEIGDINKIEEKWILGKVMQIFHDNSTLYGSALQGDSLAGTDEELKLLFSTASIEELARVWDAFQEAAYRLSVSYMVPAVQIDSTRELEVRRVVSKRVDDSYKVRKREGL